MPLSESSSSEQIGEILPPPLSRAASPVPAGCRAEANLQGSPRQQEGSDASGELLGQERLLEEPLDEYRVSLKRRMSLAGGSSAEHKAFLRAAEHAKEPDWDADLLGPLMEVTGSPSAIRCALAAATAMGVLLQNVEVDDGTSRSRPTTYLCCVGGGSTGRSDYSKMILDFAELALYIIGEREENEARRFAGTDRGAKARALYQTFAKQLEPKKRKSSGAAKEAPKIFLTTSFSDPGAYRIASEKNNSRYSNEN